MTTLPVQQLYIHGQRVDATSGKTFKTVNPATGEVIAEVQVASQADVERAVQSAAEGQRVWAAMTAMERSRILRRAVELLRERNDELAHLETLDTGKALAETTTVDIVTGADVVEYYAGLATAIEGIQLPLRESSFFYTRREPLGVVAGIGAWNYPIQIAMWKSVPAGVFNVVQGPGREIGQWLTEHPVIEKISFTGGVATGKKVMASAASSSLKEVTMELGGKSPLVICDDADLDRAADIAVMANFFSSGQVCTNGTRVFVPRSMLAAFEAAVVERVKRIRIGDPMAAETNFGPLTSFPHMENVLRYIESGKAEGARLLTGGGRATEGALANGAYVLPTVFSDCRDDMTIVREEIFGPVMSILAYDDEDEVVRRANDTTFGLAAGVVSKDVSRAHRIIHRLEAGICWINTWGESPAEMPVGGYKESGVGRENGISTLGHYTRIKSVQVELGDYASVF